MLSLSRSAPHGTLCARRRFVIFLVPLILAACVEESTSPDALRPQLAATSTEDSLSDSPAMLAVAREVPAFAGAWFDEEGQLVIAMTDMSRAREAETAVRSRMTSQATRAGDVNGISVRIVTRSAQYSFLDLVRYKTILRWL